MHGGAVRIRHVRDRAVGLARDGAGWRVKLAGGDTLGAGLVVLAVSHPMPALPAALDALRGDPRLVDNPWGATALRDVAPDDAVLIIGTGLTMADLVASLLARGHRGTITAVSRHGRLPRGHAMAESEAWEGFVGSPPATALELLRAVRRALAVPGQSWQAVVRGLTRDGQAIWAGLPMAERRRFLRHLRPLWDPHRYRVAPQIGDVLEAALASGQLLVLAATPVAAEAGARLAVTIRPRGTEARQVLPAGRLLLATGPAHGAAIATNTLLAEAAAAGLLQGDPLGLGIAVDARSRVLDAAGAPQPTLFVAGPLARGTFGELVGLPQVTEHSVAVAAEAAAWLAAP
jgi:uncharacterized NAD(P)/FAD-binding protein YdhS